MKIEGFYLKVYTWHLIGSSKWAQVVGCFEGFNLLIARGFIQNKLAINLRNLAA